MDRFHSLAPNASPTPCAILPSAMAINSIRLPLLCASLAPRAYGVGQNHFITFCLLQGIFGPSSPLLPAYEITLIYFAAHLAKTICYNTIKLYLFAVQDLHRQHNFSLKLSKMYCLQKVLTGIKRSQAPPS